MRKTFLILLVIVCLTVTAWNAYLLSTGQTDPVIGWIVLAVSVGVLLWNASVLRAHRAGTGSVVALVIIISLTALGVSALAGVGPFGDTADRASSGVFRWPRGYDVGILPGQSAAIDDWFISLDGGGWKGGTVYVELTITNLGPRRSFGLAGPRLVAVDSTGKEVEPWIPEYSWQDLADAMRKGTVLQLSPPYHKEYYPSEGWSGQVRFELSQYSGKTGLYIRLFGYPQRHYLFDLGAPSGAGSGLLPATTALQSAVIGKWRHGVPDQCPPSMDPRLYEKLKALPDSRTYFLEFAANGQVFCLDNDYGTASGSYRFVADRHVEIDWVGSPPYGARQFFLQRGVYEVQISGEKMYLRNQHEKEVSYRRAS